MKEHLVSHETDVPKVMKKKMLSWNSFLEEVKEIPVSKLSINKKKLITIFEMFMETEKVLSIFTNRNQAVKMKTVQEFYENNSKHDCDGILFRALLAINLEAYKIELYEKNIHIEIIVEKKPVTPSMLKSREQKMREKLEELLENQERYIDLVELPMPRKNVYKSAKEVLLENIVNFGDEVIERKESEDNNKSKKKKMTFPEIIEKVESRSKIVKERQAKFDQIDWQAKRIPELARLVNRIFISQEKSILMYEALKEKIKHVRGSSKVECDLNLLIEKSNGWLKIFVEWIKRDTSMEINNVCDIL